MTIRPASQLKSFFQGGDTPTTAQFGDLVDSCVRAPLQAVASAAESISNNAGAIVIEATADVTLRSAGDVGVRLAEAATTTDTRKQLNFPAAATTAQLAQATADSLLFLPSDIQGRTPAEAKAWVF